MILASALITEGDELLFSAVAPTVLIYKVLDEPTRWPDNCRSFWYSMTSDSTETYTLTVSKNWITCTLHWRFGTPKRVRVGCTLMLLDHTQRALLEISKAEGHISIHNTNTRKFKYMELQKLPMTHSSQYQEPRLQGNIYNKIPRMQILHLHTPNKYDSTKNSVQVT